HGEKAPMCYNGGRRVLPVERPPGWLDSSRGLRYEHRGDTRRGRATLFCVFCSNCPITCALTHPSDRRIHRGTASTPRCLWPRPVADGTVPSSTSLAPG